MLRSCFFSLFMLICYNPFSQTTDTLSSTETDSSTLQTVVVDSALLEKIQVLEKHKSALLEEKKES